MLLPTNYKKNKTITLILLLTGQLLPMYYYVSKTNVEKEKATPGSQEKIPSPEGSTDGVFLWGQSLLFISKLLSKFLICLL